jgi:ADP-ribose pyrophosphatase YjhB (NUDIX family)
MIDEHYRNLPKKRMGVGVLIFNNKEEVLIVKTSYKDHWSMVGGVVDEDESPRSACKREIKEEIGIDLKEVKFLSIDYRPDYKNRGESLQFIFSGGILNDEESKNIKLDGKEIIDYKFVKFDEALQLLSEKSSLGFAKSFEALKNNMAVYLEDGK